MTWEGLDDGTAALDAPLAQQGRGFAAMLARWMKAPTTKKFELEPVGAFVWSLCDGAHSFDAISRKLRERYKMNRLEADAASLGLPPDTEPTEARQPNDRQRKVSKAQFKNIDPPFRVAWNQAKAGIRVRFMRQAITSLGVALGIAFFASVMTLRLAESGSDPEAEARMKWLVGTSLVMCLVGVTNSMLMSVSERFREIGTIKCLGASDGFIVKVFFLEAAMLGAAGSLLGSALGTGLMAIVTASGRGVTAMEGFTVLSLGTLLGMLLTVVAAVVPAIQAAKMPAAAALRVEV